ncbi:MAG TPA: antitoxin AF2212-like protein [Candidatus Bathyarchaeia archaeon]|nr:antitoxin AF2212-like protein [Candidatus Bathyarchaeia archaeon]
MGIIRVKAVYENKILKPLEKLELEEGEEVEIELKRREGKKRDILRYAGILKDLSEEEERIFQEAVKRRSLFGRALKL